MSITYTIPGVPLLNQLSEASNPTYDCVFTSNAALATAYLHKPYTGTQIKALDSDDYGASYTGTASEAKLLDTMTRLGITVARVAHTTQQLLIDELHHHIPQGHACIVTMPSQWNSAPTNSAYAPWNPRTYRGPSHVGLACGVGPGMIRVMNPWGGFWQDQSDAWWARRLLYGEIWVATLAPVRTTPTPTIAVAGAGAATSATSQPAPTVLSEYQQILALRAEIARLKAARDAAVKTLTSA